ncbi:MAG: hypothetical protein OHK0022_20690 [Roseiflexaceae bacterium]
MNPTTVVALVVCLVLVALLLPGLRANLRLFQRLRQSRPLAQGLPPDDGPAKISGQASGATLSAPISGRPCVLWQIEVREFRSGPGRGGWKTRYRHTSGEHLTVSSGALLVHIHITDARLLLSGDLDASQSRFTPLSASMRARLHQLGLPVESQLGFNRQLSVAEQLIAAGTVVFAQGEVEQINGMPHLLGSPTAPLLLSDQSEQQLLERLRRRVAISAAGILSLSVSALFLALMLIF